MIEINLSADELVSRLLVLSETETVCLFDSCGVGHLGSHLLIAGIRPAAVHELSPDDPEVALELLDSNVRGDRAAIFTLSYDLGTKMQGIPSRHRQEQVEPDIFVALFECLVIHDYRSGKTLIAGDAPSSERTRTLLESIESRDAAIQSGKAFAATSNMTASEYVDAVERIRELIRRGDTYQTNLTQQLRCELAAGTRPQIIFAKLRRDHPAPFAAFIQRSNSTVVSASPERFFCVTRDGLIKSSPIKGTRKRGATKTEDEALREELRSSEKDRAENTMIVDLVRNDLGRVCEYGSVVVEKLCEIEEHPTLFHLVSTVRGRLRDDAKISDILRAVFPCGSITGAPKIRTMQIIDEIESTSRGLSMGAIGISLPPEWNFGNVQLGHVLDVSVAIRTMVIRDRDVLFNVGGGIVIDSNPTDEYEESLLKAKALLAAI